MPSRRMASSDTRPPPAQTQRPGYISRPAPGDGRTKLDTAREVEARNFIPEDDLGEAADIVLDLVAD